MKRQLTLTGSLPQVELDDMFADLDPMDPFEFKKMRLAADLVALASHCKKNRSALAEELGWSKSRVSKVLSGSGNLTLRTVWELASHLEHDFELVFHGKGDKSPTQPWEKSHQFISCTQPTREHLVPLRLQTKEEVRQDMLYGRESDMYISRVPSDHIFGSVTIVAASKVTQEPVLIPESQNNFSFPIGSISRRVPV